MSDPVSQHPRILFLARRYPPCLGGIETHCYQLYTRLSRLVPVRLVALRRQSLLHLAWFLPWAFLVAFWKILWRRVEVVYFSDGVVAALAPLLRPFGPARFAATIYGLEMTYRNPVARSLMIRGARACARVAVISQTTQDLVVRSGVPEERLRVISVGIEPAALPEEQCQVLRARFEEEHGIRFGQDRILLTVGRQVRRKGIADFLEKGMPLLEPDIRLIVGGKGPEVERICQVRERLGLQGRVLVIGPPPDDVLAMLRASADLFIMPNIRVPGDVEGFGMAPLEAMSAGAPGVVFAVDALVESVREGGYLVAPGDYQGFADQIHGFYALSAEARAAEREEARAYVRRGYSWDQTAQQYLELFKGTL